MTRLTLICLLGSLFGAAGCGSQPRYFIPSQAIATTFPSAPEARVAIEPQVGDRRFEELGVLTVWTGTKRKRKRDKLLRAAASKEGAHAVIDVKLVTKVPTMMLYGVLPLGWKKVYAATLIRWKHDADTSTETP